MGLTIALHAPPIWDCTGSHFICLHRPTSSMGLQVPSDVICLTVYFAENRDRQTTNLDSASHSCLSENQTCVRESLDRYV